VTYSIVARDPDSGRFGVAIQTCWPFVGAACPWVESGVGAVVTAPGDGNDEAAPDWRRRRRFAGSPATEGGGGRTSVVDGCIRL
jgi:hypothetical protein